MLTAVGALFLQSCRTYKYVPYFKDVSDSARIAIKTAMYHPLVIQQGDVLTINVMTIDPQANAIFNQAPSTVQGNGGSITPLQPTGSPYMVSPGGNIDLPLLGSFPAAGMTTDSLRLLIQDKAAQFYKTPSVSVNFANLKVNVMGEVARPGAYVLTGQKNTILDALTLAGDLSIYGKRQNALLIRDSSGYTLMKRFSLNTKDLVTEDFFYLKQNDVIYIEPDKSKAGALDMNQTRIFAIIVSVVSLIIVLAARFN